jgi:predicted DNA-binding transcriptional regulator YafY/predicted nucleotidyltransferase
MAGDEPKTLRMIDLLRSLLAGEGVIKKEFCRKWNIVPRTFERYLLDLEDLHLRLDRDSIILDGRKSLKITLRREQPAGPLIKPEAHLAFLVSKILLKNYAPGLDQKLDEVLKTARNAPYNDLDYLALFPFMEHTEELSSLLVSVSLAIQKRIVLEYLFSDVPRRVHPYGIFCYRNHWYVYGLEVERDGEASGQEKTFRTDRIRDLKLLDQKSFEYPQNFSMKAFLEDSIGLFFNSKPCVVKVKVNQKCAEYFKKRRHYPSQKITEELDNGGLILQYRVNHPTEFLMFAKAWIPNMVILSPENYKSMMMEILHEAVSAYNLPDRVSSPEIEPVRQGIESNMRTPGPWNPPRGIQEHVEHACELIHKELRDKKANLIIYGSCVRGASTPADIDIAIDSKKPISSSKLKKLGAALKHSEIPYPVDLVDLSAASPALRAVIEKEGMVWSPGNRPT